MKGEPFHYYKVYKPFGYLSQFTPDHPGQLTLKDLFNFPPNVYPIGRLDKDSEGLLLLTNDKSQVERILHPKQKTPKVYLAQVEGIPTDSDLEILRHPLKLRIRKKQVTLSPACVNVIPPPKVADREPPVRFRKNIPTSWIEIEVTEGKYHQVRKMCAHIGFPVLRLVRWKIGTCEVDLMTIGGVERQHDFSQV